MNQEAVLAKFIQPSYTSYAGLSGVQDFTPLGFQLKRRVIDAWRELLPRNVHEVELPQLTPEAVLRASGHLDRFHDYMITNNQGKSFRADHVVAADIEAKLRWKVWVKSPNGETVPWQPPAKSVDTMTAHELDAYIHAENLLEETGPDSQKIPLRDHVTVKNLVYEAGSTREPGQRVFLRPELAQGIFVGFSDYSSQYQLPFGVSQVGRSFRQEISPKEFTRLREFTQYETEFFYDPADPGLQNPSRQLDGTLTPSAPSESDLVVPFWVKNLGPSYELVLMSVSGALTNGIICNNIMAGFISLVYKLCQCIGLTQVRFRKHEPDEMAHYAVECWDLEALIDDKWLEVVGIAHRGDFDLRAHQVPMLKRGTFHEEIVRKVQIATIKSLPTFKEIMADVNLLGDIAAAEKHGLMEIPGAVVQKVIKVPDTYLPHCIEPSLGIDRLVYALLKQNYHVRSGLVTEETKVWLSLPPAVTLYDLAILPLSNKDSLVAFSNVVIRELAHKHPSRVQRYASDFSGQSIGKRYLRQDSIGVPFCVTIDFDSLKDHSVVVRNRETTHQIRIGLAELIDRSSNVERLYELFLLSSLEQAAPNAGG